MKSVDAWFHNFDDLVRSFPPSAEFTGIQLLSDVPQSTDQYMEPAQHEVQVVLNISTEVHVFHRTGQTDCAVYSLQKICTFLAHDICYSKDFITNS